MNYKGIYCPFALRDLNLDVYSLILRGNIWPTHYIVNKSNSANTLYYRLGLMESRIYILILKHKRSDVTNS